MRILPEHRVAILQHGGIRGHYGKTGLALLRYSEAQIVAVIDAECAGSFLPALTGIAREVPIVASLREALHFQPHILVTGIAPPGGALPDPWWQEVKEAVAAGLCVVNGLHTPMEDHPDLKPLLREGQWIWDVRREPPGLTLGSGAARELPCLRVLTVGTDMAIGKMSTSIELHRASLRRGLRSAFIASGQTGIMIAGDGVPLDAVRVDFAAGAVEQIVMRYGREHDILHIEGQGSLLNPASTATLPLIRGSQPTHLILVHRAGQAHIRSYPHVPIPPLREVVRLYEMVTSAAGAFAPAPVVGIALNTAHLSEEEALQAIVSVESETGLPCTDAVRLGADKLLDAILPPK